MFFNEKHIRVYKPITTNGMNPKVDDQGRVMQKIVHLPYTSLPFLERKNSRLPNHLKMKIEVIDFAPQIEPPKQSKRVKNDEN